MLTVIKWTLLATLSVQLGGIKHIHDTVSRHYHLSTVLLRLKSLNILFPLLQMAGNSVNTTGTSFNYLEVAGLSSFKKVSAFCLPLLSGYSWAWVPPFIKSSNWNIQNLTTNSI